MKKGDMLFVYGTLRLGQSADLSKKDYSEYIGEDKINGRLYDMGWYPGVKTEPGHFDPGLSSVSGDVFLILADNLVKSLDDYEGYPGLYNRFETETAEGRHVWVYVYNGEVATEDRIPSGDWNSYSSNLREPSILIAALLA